MQRVYTLLLLLFFTQSPAMAELKVFACEPEWGALISELAGDKAEVSVATTAFQDVHHIQARPSLIARVRQTDLLVCTGADLEIGWLPVLLQRASNPGVMPGEQGYFLAADYVHMLGVPAVLDRAEGDVHPAGNPHIQMDPGNYPPIATALAQRLAQLDTDNAAFYQARAEDFAARWRAATERWTQRAQPLKGMQTVVYHDAWTYMNRWLSLDQLAELEPKPGMPPTSSHLSDVLKTMQRDPARVIIRAPYDDGRAVDWLHEHTGIPGLVLPFTVGGNAQAGDLYGLFDSTLDLLLSSPP
jgi:zinc/manganese transport system substrate-binding protein